MYAVYRFLTFISFYFYFMSFLLHINLCIVVSVTLVALQFLLRRVRFVLYVLCCE